MMQKKSSPSDVAASEGLLPLFNGRPDRRLSLSVVSVKPFANVVSYYACHNGNDKCNEDFQWRTSFPLERVDSSNSIP